MEFHMLRLRWHKITQKEEDPTEKSERKQTRNEPFSIDTTAHIEY